jgi:hypothetical protein
LEEAIAKNTAWYDILRLRHDRRRSDLKRQFNNNCFILVVSTPWQEEQGAYVLLCPSGDFGDAELLTFALATLC